MSLVDLLQRDFAVAEVGKKKLKEGSGIKRGGNFLGDFVEFFIASSCSRTRRGRGGSF